MTLKITNLALFSLIAGMTTAQASFSSSLNESSSKNSIFYKIDKSINLDAASVNFSEDESPSTLFIKKIHVDTVIDNGQLMSYHDNGAVKSIEYYKKGKLHGEKTSYFPSGIVEYVENYKNGLLIGDRLEYFENGQLSIKTSYKKGKLTGLWYSYNSNGAVEGYGYYEDDEKVIIFSRNATE